MSVTTKATQIKQAGNGTQVTFNFPFKILASTDIVTTKFAADGSESGALVLGVDYTVLFDAVGNTGGSVTYVVAPVSGGASFIERVSDNTQQTVYPREGTLPAKTTEAALDKLTLLIQELQASLIVNSTTQKDIFANLDALATNNPTVPFTAIVTDNRVIGVYLGDRTLGQNGWAFYGGF